MQHLDEGTIHSWLDGALSAEEAARVEAHVVECPQCATAVAEARGFIAASSRILTALDHVPGGVVPAALPVRWYNRAAWRAAAAVLVVAVGSLVVIRDGRNNAPVATRELKKPATASAPSTQSALSSSAASRGRAAAEADFSGKPVRGAAPIQGVARERARDEGVDAVTDRNAAAPPQVAGAVMATPQGAVSSRVAGVAMMDAVASEPLPLKVVGTPRVLGAKVTLYEVAPGDTVTFTEALNIQLNAVVTTGMSSAQPQARRSVQKSAAPAPTQPPSQSGAAPPLQVEIANGVTSISWPDVATGNMLKLSGHMSVERLTEIKRRIERERAAPAKKSP
jgi:anti-sigma factor RsiW